VLRIHIFKSQFFFIKNSFSFEMNLPCSKVLPAVLDSELSVDVIERSTVLPGVRVHVYLRPLDGVRDVWEASSVIGMVLKSLGHSIVQPVGVRARECAMCIVDVVASPVTKSKIASLTAKLPVVSIISNVSSSLLVVEFLMGVLLNPLIEVAWHSWEVVESWGTDSILIFTSDNQWSTFLLGGDGMEIHASAWLHSGCHWLRNLLGEFWDSIALNNLDIEVHIGSKWDWLTTDWCPGEGSTVSIVGWARKMSLVTLVKLWDSKIPAVEDFSSSEREGLWLASVLSSGAGDMSTILEVSIPVNSGPVSWLALGSGSRRCNINTDSGEIVVGTGVLIVITIRSIHIWTISSLLLDSSS
jgi:hypothetical protein